MAKLDGCLGPGLLSRLLMKKFVVLTGSGNRFMVLELTERVSSSGSCSRLGLAVTPEG